jgi:hypothetical protein
MSVNRESLNDDARPHFDAFMAAVRGVPAHHVAMALAEQQWTSASWASCGKGFMAYHYAQQKSAGTSSLGTGLRAVDVDKLGRQARARAALQIGWRSA